MRLTVALALIAWTVGQFVWIYERGGPPLQQAAYSSSYFEVPLFHCDDYKNRTCTVRSAPGGLVSEHVEAAGVMLYKRERVIVDGTCASACTILVDILAAHGLACVTPNARLMYHAARARMFDGSLKILPISYESKMLRGWILGRGGLPVDGFLTLTGGDAAAVYPSC